MDAIGLEPELVASDHAFPLKADARAEPRIAEGALSEPCGGVAGQPPGDDDAAADALELPGCGDIAANASRPCDLRRAFDRCADGLWRFILVRAGGDGHAAEDLLQQTCLEAARSRKAPSDEAGCEAFIFGIARNLLRKHWRRMKRRGISLPAQDAQLGSQLAALMEAGPLAQDVLAGRETREQLMLAITALTAADQQLVFAYYFDGRSHVQIAAELGLSSKSVESRLYRVRMRLRAMLRGVGPDSGYWFRAL